jgi:tight adherence protein B
LPVISLAAALLAMSVLAAPPPARRPAEVLGRHRSNRRPIGLLAAAAVVAAAVVAAAVAVVAAPAVTIAASLVVATAAAARCRRRRRCLRRTEGRALAAALEILVGELRVGAHPLRAFGVAAAEADGTVGAGLHAVAVRARLGADVGAGLRSVQAGSAVPTHWERIAVCWNLAARHGLAISTLMTAAHRDLADRQRFADRVDSGLAGARATATILAVLPVLGVLLGELVGAAPVRFLLDGGAGGWLLVAGVALGCAGAAWSGHIIDRLVP